MGGIISPPRPTPSSAEVREGVCLGNCLSSHCGLHPFLQAWPGACGRAGTQAVEAPCWASCPQRTLWSGQQSALPWLAVPGSAGLSATFTGEPCATGCSGIVELQPAMRVPPSSCVSSTAILRCSLCWAGPMDNGRWLWPCRGCSGWGKCGRFGEDLLDAHKELRLGVAGSSSWVQMKPWAAAQLRSH